MENISGYKSNMSSMDQYEIADNMHSFVIDDTFKYSNKNNTGRINLDAKFQHNGTPFFVQDMIPNNERTNYSNATQHMLTPTMLSTMFFSAENIDIVQNGIRAGVHKMSNGELIVDKQDYDQIKIVMRAIYLQYSLHKEDNIREQIEELNKMVLDYCIPKVYGEAVSYMKYRRDISTLPTPQENPTYLAVDRTLELKHFF